VTPQDLIAAFEQVAEAPDGVTRLRELVLQLAVRGKLVPQDPEDEPAERLLERISAEKARLVREKKIRKPKVLPPIQSEEAPFDVSDGWSWARAGSLGEVLRGVTYQKAQASDAPASDRVKLLRAHNIQRALQLHKLVFVPLGVVKENQYLRDGDILFCIASGSARLVGKSARVVGDIDATFGAFTAIVRPFQSDTSEYIELFTHSPAGRELLMGEGQGIGIKNLKTTALGALPIPLPPLTEQHRIVARVDELFSLLDRLETARDARETTRAALRAAALAALADADTSEEVEAAWDRIAGRMDDLFTRPEDIEPLRQTVLQLAVRGRLVPQDPEDEPAERLLERCATTDKKAPVAVLGAAEPFPIPPGWKWSRLDWLATLINGDRSKNYPNRNEYVDSGVPWMNTGHIDPDGRLSPERMHYITREKFDSLRSGKVSPGDLVYCLRGATIGKTARVSPFVEGAVASSLVIIRPRIGTLTPYLYRYLVSPLGKTEVRKFDNGSAQPNLAAKSVRKYLVPTPPLAEQHRIVAKVDALMALLDGLEERLRAAHDTQAAFAAAAVHHMDA
jgi:type I restriction enzyme, S subunit